MPGPEGPTEKGYQIRAVHALPKKPSVPVTPGMSLGGPSAPPPSAPPAQQTPPPMAPPPSAPPPSSNGLIAPAPPPRAPRQLAPDLPPMPLRVAPQAPPPAFSEYVVEGVSAAANRLVQGAARDLPTEQSFVGTQRLLNYLFEYWKEQCTSLRVEGTSPEGAWTYDDVISGKVVLENDYAALLASAEKLWIDQGQDETRLPEGDYVGYIRELLTNPFEPEMISHYVDPGRVSSAEVKLLQAFHDLASALLFYKAAQVVEDRVEKSVLLTSGALPAVEAAEGRFSGMKVPPVITKYSRMLLQLKIAPAIARLGR